MSKVSDMFYSGIRKSQVDRSISKRQAATVAQNERESSAVIRNPNVYDGHPSGAANDVPYAGVATDVCDDSAVRVLRLKTTKSPFTKKKTYRAQKIIRVCPKLICHRIPQSRYRIVFSSKEEYRLFIDTLL